MNFFWLVFCGLHWNQMYDYYSCNIYLRKNISTLAFLFKVVLVISLLFQYGQVKGRHFLLVALKYFVPILTWTIVWRNYSYVQLDQEYLQHLRHDLEPQLYSLI